MTLKGKVTFKSTPVNYVREYKGLKSNTVRVYDKEDYRFYLLTEFMLGNLKALDIVIKNTETGEEFTRKVKDVTLFQTAVDIYIISW